MIYADNAATTKLSEAALSAMLPYLREEYGNPSGLYAFAQRQKEVLERCRGEIAKILNCEAREIYFASGGSEADNQALLSLAAAGEKKGKKHIVSTAFEHHAVLHTLRKLQARGFEVTLLPVHEDGIVRPEEAEAAIRPDTAFVTVMYANNEIGTIQPISAIGEICARRGVPFHTDAVQAAGHLNIDVRAENIDALSLSAHKFHGPKGVGALYFKKTLPLASLIEGGAQERNRRAGTENVAGIVGMTAALQEEMKNLEKNREYVCGLRDKLIAGLKKIPHSRLNGDEKRRLAGDVVGKGRGRAHQSVPPSAGFASMGDGRASQVGARLLPLREMARNRSGGRRDGISGIRKRSDGDLRDDDGRNARKQSFRDLGHEGQAALRKRQVEMV